MMISGSQTKLWIFVIFSHLSTFNCETLTTTRLSDDDFVEFKRKNVLKDSSTMLVQEISSTISHKGIEYTLDDLEQFSVVSTKYNTPFINSRNKSPLWRKDINGTMLLAIKNENEEIEHVSILKDDDRVDFVAVNDTDGHQVFATISLADYDDDKINTLTRNHKDAFKYSVESNDHAKTDPSTLVVPRQKSDHCTTFRMIEVAIAYDSTLCKRFSYSKDQTDRHVQAIVGLASQFYEPMCLKLEISYIEGYCDESRDPFRDIVRSKSILERYTMLWRSERSSVSRDVAHLLTGSNFEPGVLGYAFKATMCTTQNAFGANYITWSENIALQAALFAHELGHNAGADHFGSECTNWLMAPCGNGLGGFSDESKEAVIQFLGKQSCLSSEAAIPPPREFDVSNSGNFMDNFFTSFGDPTFGYNPNQIYNAPDRGPPYIPPYYNGDDGYFNKPVNSPTNNNDKATKIFKIRSKAVKTKCLTLRIINGNLKSQKVGEKKVVLKYCQNNLSPKQGWKYNPETSYIHSALDKGLCLVPRFESNNSYGNNQKKRRTRLTVDICPYVRSKKFQWRVTNSGLIVNMQKDTDGTPLIIQASRGVNKGNQEVLLIPTLSRFSNDINDFFRWSISSAEET